MIQWVIDDNHCFYSTMVYDIQFTKLWFTIRATENRFFAGPDQFLVCRTDSVCIKCIFFGPNKHTLWIIYWPNYLDWSSVKPLIVHNYQSCQLISY